MANNNNSTIASFVKAYPHLFVRNLVQARQEAPTGEEYFALNAADFLGMPNGWVDLRLLWPELDSNGVWVCRVGISFIRAAGKQAVPAAEVLRRGQSGGTGWCNFNTPLIPIQALFDAGYLGEEMVPDVQKFMRGEFGDRLRLIASKEAFLDFSIRENINPGTNTVAKSPLIIENIAFGGFSSGNSNNSVLQGFGRAPARPASAPSVTEVEVANPRRTYAYRLANGLLDQGSAPAPAKAADAAMDFSFDEEFNLF